MSGRSAGSQVRACLITNSRAGHGALDLREPIAVLEAHGWKVRIRDKQHGGQATDLARGAAQDGCDVVVACAGDGTVSEVVDGLVGTDLAVGVLPAGTANLWAHELGIARQLRTAAFQLALAQRRRVDVGHVTVNGHHGQHFLLMAGLGFDGAAIGHVSKPLKRRTGALAVGVAAVQALPSYQPESVHAMIDGRPWHGCVSQVVLGNTRRYAGFTRMTPHALIDDGLLDICLITAVNPLTVGRQLASLVFRQQPSSASATTFRAGSFILEAPTAMPLQIDGGAVRQKKVHAHVGPVTYRFSTVRLGITMLVPRTYDGALFQHRTPDDVAPASPRGEESWDAEAVPADHARRKESRRRFRVLEVGGDSFTAVQCTSGRSITVHIRNGVTIEHERGATDASRVLAPVHPGDVVRVKGKLDDNAVVRATRVTVLAQRYVAR